MLITCVELWERCLFHVSESPGPGTLVESSHTSKDLFSASYLPLFLNVLGTKLILEENSAVMGGKRACPGPWPLTRLASLMTGGVLMPFHWPSLVPSPPHPQGGQT